MQVIPVGKMTVEVGANGQSKIWIPPNWDDLHAATVLTSALGFVNQRMRQIAKPMIITGKN
jgi:hypothetical protein